MQRVSRKLSIIQPNFLQMCGIYPFTDTFIWIYSTLTTLELNINTVQIPYFIM